MGSDGPVAFEETPFAIVDDGRRRPDYTISPPSSLMAQVSLNSNGTACSLKTFSINYFPLQHNAV